MARFSPPFFSLIFILLTSIIRADDSPVAILCPTVTKTTSKPSCPLPTPAICPQPQCIFLSTIKNPCGCPTIVPTATSYTACPTVCQGACGTAYQTIRDCQTITTSPTVTIITDPPPTTTTNKCVTVTDTTGSTCPTLNCEVPDCIVLSSITQNCGCNEIFHTTKCKSKCDGSCSTQYKTLYIPCAYTGPFLTATVGPVETLTAL